MQVCAEYKISVDYTGVDGVQKYLSLHSCLLLSTHYDERVQFSVAVKKADEQTFIQGLVDYMQGKVKTERGREYFSAFEQ